MFTIYFFAIKFYYFLIWIFSFFNNKAEKWIKGRKNWRTQFQPNSTKKRIWFHFASLGEFEQGKPLLQAVRNHFPEKEILITFFSPSGYEIRKNTPLADIVLYLPLDTPKNAKDFINLFKPEIAIFNKYEYWYCFFEALHKQQIPIYITSSIFRANQIFFKFYGGFNRRILGFVNHFFVQNKESGMLLESIGFSNYTLSGDTRFDSVLDLVKNKKEFPLIDDFKRDKKLVITGSTWPEDEAFLKNCPFLKSDAWKLIIAPHEISENHLQTIESYFEGHSIRYSELAKLQSDKENNIKILIIDNIGMLSSLYSYGEIAYIGGGFGAGIHNTLEPAAWGLPVIFGPKHDKFQEAKDLVRFEGGFTFSNQNDLNNIFNRLIDDEVWRRQSGKIAKDYVAKNTGATQIIMQQIFKY
ncbi:3-deoxy-D-manno-octulosonic acid transferase [Pelobium sp.]|nr:glycosyltransferase N-terminal domain-containing protein [Pelobium sp.]MDA9555299.1 3-deoxy-D-manno-octulosonic acid transferase [Pelobium sp.]